MVDSNHFVFWASHIPAITSLYVQPSCTQLWDIAVCMWLVKIQVSAILWSHTVCLLQNCLFGTTDNIYAWTIPDLFQLITNWSYENRAINVKCMRKLNTKRMSIDWHYYEWNQNERRKKIENRCATGVSVESHRLLGHCLSKQLKWNYFYSEHEKLK